MRAVSSISILAFVLAACGGSSSDPTTRTVTPTSAQLGSTSVGATLNAARSVITVDVNGTPTPETVNPALTQGTFLGGATLGGPDNTLISYVSETDASRAHVTLYSISGAVAHAGSFARLTPTELPLTGSATFTGDYVGTFIEPDTGRIAFSFGTVGDLMLSADFAAATIDGEITNRRIVGLTSGTEFTATDVADVTLMVTPITENGGFSGTATGGDLIAGSSGTGLPLDSNTDAGTFRGLIAGSTGTEAVGALDIAHSIAGDTLNEIGSFAAGH